MVEPFAFMIRRQTKTEAAEAYAKMIATFKEATASPQTLKMAEEQGMAPFIDYWTPEQCNAYVNEFQATWNKYKHLMD